jgi:Outer membrane protein beta-barrel domain
MKKTIFILIVAVFCLQITGLSQKSRVGVTGGVSVAQMRGTVDGKDIDANSKTGLTFGLIVDAPIKNHFSFQPGLHYVQKGKVQDEVSGNIKQTVTTDLRYAELQLNFLYNTNYNTENKEANFFVGAGPALSVNFPSKFVTEIGGTKTESDITFGNLSEDFRGFDFGANFLAGLRFNGGFFVSVNYTLGLRNLVPGGSDTDKIKNSCFGIRVGLLVNNK